MQESRKEVMDIREYLQTLFCNDPTRSSDEMSTDLSAINARISGGVMRLRGGGGRMRGVSYPRTGGQHKAGQGRLPRAGRVGGEARPHHVGAWARGRDLVTVATGHRESET